MEKFPRFVRLKTWWRDVSRAPGPPLPRRRQPRHVLAEDARPAASRDPCLHTQPRLL